MSSVIKTPPVYRIAGTQLLIALVVAGLASVILGIVGAYSLFLGTLISILPNTYFSKRVFRHSGARSTDKVLKGFFVGEVVKLAMMGAGFAAVFILVDPLNEFALFAGFIMIHITWMISWYKMQEKLKTG